MTLPNPARLTAALLAMALVVPAAGFADHTPDPAQVTLAGSFQSELGCAGDWMPDCPGTALTYNGNNGLWIANFLVPAGNWEYKVALDGSWDENYGAGGVPNGPNLALSLAVPHNVTFLYDHDTHVVTHQVAPVVVAVGSHQSETGCAGDWMPDCLATQLLDPDLDGVFTHATSAIPPGSYEFKVALDRSWTVNFGAGGVPNGPNVPFVVPGGGALVTFRWDSATQVPTVTVEGPSKVARPTWTALKRLYR